MVLIQLFFSQFDFIFTYFIVIKFSFDPTSFHIYNILLDIATYQAS